jgi:hypothetical protein
VRFLLFVYFLCSCYLCNWPYGCCISIILLLWYGIFVNCNWVATRWQQYSTVHIYTQTVHRTTQWNRIPRTEHT